MKAVAGQSVPRKFQELCAAFEQATRLPRSSKLQLRVGVLTPQGKLAAQGVLEGYRQAASFASQAATLGYAERMWGPVEEMCGCDIVFIPSEAVARLDTAVQQREFRPLPSLRESAFSPLR